MPQRFDTLSGLLSHGFDDVIDVRSPAEFAEDHIPGALNLPALSNEERARIGTIYKQVSPFTARKIGAALVARNVAHHLETTLADRDGGWRPLVHCWRGGQRSGSVAAILGQIGWRADTIAGGYQTFRRLVHNVLYDQPLPHRLILLDGNTGTAKTDLLHRLAARGIQIIDLEGLAGHRGSLLGARAAGQPSQKAFETRLAVALTRLDPARPVLVEAESNKIGQRSIPPMLWAAMKMAKSIKIDVGLSERAKFLALEYSDLIASEGALRTALDELRRYRGHETVDRWVALLDAGAHVALAEALMRDHYDPAYAKSRAAQDPDVLARFEAAGLAEPQRDALADQIAGWMRRFTEA